MTELQLQAAIQKVLKQEILPEISIFQPGEMNVFLQDLPLSTEFEDEDEQDKHFPCCIVKIQGAEIKTASDAQITTVETIVCIRDSSEDMSGYQTLLVCLQRIRDYFTAHVGIEGKYRMIYPIEWAINDEAPAPYFIGGITTKWVTDIMPYRDPKNFL